MALFPFWFFQGACFEEGYPGGAGPVEPDVAFQLLFDEASGSLTDEVSGVVLAPSGAPSYGANATGKFRHLAPGITFDGSSYFYKASATASLDLGTDDAVLEFWFSTTYTGTQYVFMAGRNAPVTDFYSVSFSSGGTYGRLSLSLFDALTPPTRAATWNFSQNWLDGGIHKARIALDRDVGATLEIDDVFETASSDTTTAYAANPVSASGMYVGADRSGANRFVGSLWELRVTIGNSTNNSTPVWYP